MVLPCRFVFEQPIQVSRLVRDLADRAQVATQRSWKRPYGVGILSAGYDKTGSHLYYNCPSGAYYDYKAMAIGARSQVRIAVVTLSLLVLKLCTNVSTWKACAPCIFCAKEAACIPCGTTADSPSLASHCALALRGTIYHDKAVRG